MPGNGQIIQRLRTSYVHARFEVAVKAAGFLDVFF